MSPKHPKKGWVSRPRMDSDYGIFDIEDSTAKLALEVLEFLRKKHAQTLEQPHDSTNVWTEVIEEIYDLIEGKADFNRTILTAARVKTRDEFDECLCLEPPSPPEFFSEFIQRFVVNQFLNKFGGNLQQHSSNIIKAVEDKLMDLTQPIIQEIMRQIAPIKQYVIYDDQFNFKIKDEKVLFSVVERAWQISSQTFIAQVFDALNHSQHSGEIHDTLSLLERLLISILPEKVAHAERSQSMQAPVYSPHTTFLEYVFREKENSRNIWVPLTITKLHRLQSPSQRLVENVPRNTILNAFLSDTSPVYTSERPSKVGRTLPSFIDLSGWCSPVQDQGELNSCTAHAGTALVEYMCLYKAAQESGDRQYDILSNLFLYQAALQLDHGSSKEDRGVSTNSTMEALVRFGVPPEAYWPKSKKLEDIPDHTCYQHGYKYRDIKYFRLDRDGMRAEDLLAQIKVLLAAKLPCMFAVHAYTELTKLLDSHSDCIAPPANDASLNWNEEGHALVAVGYDDQRQTSGALLVRNSWGEDWGTKGYAWLPYAYVLNNLVDDCWALLSLRWAKDINFGVGHPVGLPDPTEG
ncbi:MAG: C1 family peptidase [Leptolyngbyaceae bacterium]|nr:C1 family peptidase [Leptolyngbyaceae bacterium]